MLCNGLKARASFSCLKTISLLSRISGVAAPQCVCKETSLTQIKFIVMRDEFQAHSHSNKKVSPEAAARRENYPAGHHAVKTKQGAVLAGRPQFSFPETTKNQYRAGASAADSYIKPLMSDVAGKSPQSRPPLSLSQPPKSGGGPLGNKDVTDRKTKKSRHKTLNSLKNSAKASLNYFVYIKEGV